MRDINKVLCSCGGTAEYIATTDAEEQAHGCGRRGCCVEAMVCNKCGTRWTIALAAPEYNDGP